MSRTQLRHSSVDNSPMVISWRSRETDPSLTPTRDGSVLNAFFGFRERVRPSRRRARKRSKTDACVFFRFPERTSSHARLLFSSQKRKSFGRQVSDGARRKRRGVERDKNATKKNARRPLSARMTMTSKDFLMTDDTGGVNDDQHHILGHLTTGFVPGVIDNITLSIPDTSSRSSGGRRHPWFFFFFLAGATSRDKRGGSLNLCSPRPPVTPRARSLPQIEA